MGVLCGGHTDGQIRKKITFSCNVYVSITSILTRFARQCPCSRLMVGVGVAVLSTLSVLVYSPSLYSCHAVVRERDHLQYLFTNFAYTSKPLIVVPLKNNFSLYSELIICPQLHTLEIPLFGGLPVHVHVNFCLAAGILIFLQKNPMQATYVQHTGHCE